MFEDEKAYNPRQDAARRAKLQLQASQRIEFLSLPPEERLRIGWLRADLGRLKRGEITQAALRKNLTADELQRYKDQCARLEFEDVKQVPYELKKYVEIVKKADQMNAAADRCKTYEKAVKARNQSEHLYERALECLEETLHENDGLRVFLDRDIDFSPEGNLSIDPVGIPRLKTSKSMHNQFKPAKIDKRAELIEFVEHIVNGFKWP